MPACMPRPSSPQLLEPRVASPQEEELSPSVALLAQLAARGTEVTGEAEPPGCSGTDDPGTCGQRGQCRQKPGWDDAEPAGEGAWDKLSSAAPQFQAAEAWWSSASALRDLETPSSEQGRRLHNF